MMGLKCKACGEHLSTTEQARRHMSGNCLNMTFKTQADIQRYLLEEEGRKVQSTRSNEVFGYIDGRLWNITVNRISPVNFSIPKDWQPYQEPRPWYETAEPGTVLCCFKYDNDMDEEVAGVFNGLVKGVESHRFLSLGYGAFLECRPLTTAEIEPFLEAARRIEEMVKDG